MKSYSMFLILDVLSLVFAIISAYFWALSAQIKFTGNFKKIENLDADQKENPSDNMENSSIDYLEMDTPGIIKELIIYIKNFQFCIPSIRSIYLKKLAPSFSKYMEITGKFNKQAALSMCFSMLFMALNKLASLL